MSIDRAAPLAKADKDSASSGQAVIVWGEVLWDRFPDGHKLGGAPTNVAWHLGLAGSWARLVSRVGNDDAGRRAIEQLSAVCDVDLVQIDPERATGEVLVDNDHEPRYTLVPDRAWERIECTSDVATAISEACAFVYGTLAQHTAAGLQAWRQAALTAYRHGCLSVCDINLRRTVTSSRNEQEAVLQAVEFADIVEVNDRELTWLGEWWGTVDPLSVLLYSRAKAPLVVVTHGKEGATIYGDGSPVRVAGVQASPRGDNVGCGDAFVAILVHGMTLGWDVQTCVNAASRWAAAVAGERGATPMFSEEQVAQLLRDAGVSNTP